MPIDYGPRIPDVFHEARAAVGCSPGRRRQEYPSRRYPDRSATRTQPVGVCPMRKTSTRPYDVAEHLRTPEEMAAYLEACLEEADGDAAFVAKALGDIARAKGHVPGGARRRALPREPLQGPLRRAQPRLRHNPQSRQSPRIDAARRGRFRLPLRRLEPSGRITRRRVTGSAGCGPKLLRGEWLPVDSLCALRTAGGSPGVEPLSAVGPPAQRRYCPRSRRRAGDDPQH